MTQQQKIIAGVLAVGALILIILGATRESSNEPNGRNNMGTTSTSTVNLPGDDNDLDDDTVYTGGQTASVIKAGDKALTGGNGMTFVSPAANPNDKIVFSDISTIQTIGGNTDKVYVVYQQTILGNSYAYLALFRNNVQKSRLFLGENVKVTSMSASSVSGGSYTLNINLLDQKETESPTATPTVEKNLTVRVINGMIDFDSAQLK